MPDSAVFLSLSRTHTFSLSLSLSHTLSHAYMLSILLSHTLSLTHTVSHAHILSHSPSLAHSLSLYLSHSLSLSLFTHTHSLSCCRRAGPRRRCQTTRCLWARSFGACSTPRARRYVGGCAELMREIGRTRVSERAERGRERAERQNEKQKQRQRDRDRDRDRERCLWAKKIGACSTPGALRYSHPLSPSHTHKHIQIRAYMHTYTPLRPKP